VLVGIAGSNPAGGMDICPFVCCVGFGLCDGLITRSEESYRVCVCVCVCVSVREREIFCPLGTSNSEAAKARFRLQRDRTNVMYWADKNKQNVFVKEAGV
jgi:hypothetical protein